MGWLTENTIPQSFTQPIHNQSSSKEKIKVAILEIFDSWKLGTADLRDFYRNQFVVVSGQNSEPIGIKKGVPQGSNLFPFFYNLYMNDLPNVLSLECPRNQNLVNQIIFPMLISKLILFC